MVQGQYINPEKQGCKKTVTLNGKVIITMRAKYTETKGL